MPIQFTCRVKVKPEYFPALIKLHKFNQEFLAKHAVPANAKELNAAIPDNDSLDRLYAEDERALPNLTLWLAGEGHRALPFGPHSSDPSSSSTVYKVFHSTMFTLTPELFMPNNMTQGLRTYSRFDTKFGWWSMLGHPEPQDAKFFAEHVLANVAEAIQFVHPDTEFAELSSLPRKFPIVAPMGIATKDMPFSRHPVKDYFGDFVLGERDHESDAVRAQTSWLRRYEKWCQTWASARKLDPNAAQPRFPFKPPVLAAKTTKAPAAADS